MEQSTASPAEVPSAESMENAGFKQLSATVLDGDHREVLDRAVARILSTNIAEVTYAQIVDGLPIADVAYDSAAGGPYDWHPINDVYTQLCPGMLDKIREFRDGFRPEVLQFDSRVRSKRHLRILTL